MCARRLPAQRKLVLSIVALVVLSVLIALATSFYVSVGLPWAWTGSDGIALQFFSSVPAPGILENISFTDAGARAALVVTVENSTGYSDNENSGQSHGMRLLMYFTTFPKRQHLDVFETCWPALISRGKVLRSADVLVFLGGKATNEQLSRWRSAVRKLGVKATLRHDPSNPGYQQGAMRAVHVLMQNGWWRGYDWVVRLNPDVLIYDDAYLQRFLLDRKLSAVLANCGRYVVEAPRKTKWAGLGKVQTDFFAMRPSRIPKGAFADWKSAGNAEVQATRVFWDIIKGKECAWLVPLNQDADGCRTRGLDSLSCMSYSPAPCSIFFQRSMQPLIFLVSRQWCVAWS